MKAALHALACAQRSVPEWNVLLDALAVELQEAAATDLVGERYLDC